jgi:hypothetical protein
MSVDMSDTPIDTFISTIEGAGSCLKCRYVLPRLVECAPTYFQTGSIRCTECGESVDLWLAALDRAKRLSGMPSWALASLGPGQTSFTIPMETGKFYPLDLTNHQVPAGARILTRHYSPQGGDQGMVTAVEWHPNDPTHRPRGTLLQLFAVPILEGSLPRVGPVLVNVTWIRGENSDEWSYLVTAFDAAAKRDYAPALVFAQSAVEISMMPMIEQNFTKHASERRVKSFMRDSLTYNHALNVVLPYLCGEARTAQMPKVIRLALNKLGEKRNKIIHAGTKAAAISAEDAMEGLCAAAFGFEYIRYISPALLTGPKNPTPQLGSDT